MIQDNMLKISFMLFLLPLIAVLSGIYAGSLVVSYSGYNGMSPMVAGRFCSFLWLFFSYTHMIKNIN